VRRVIGLSASPLNGILNSRNHSALVVQANVVEWQEAQDGTCRVGHEGVRVAVGNPNAAWVDCRRSHLVMGLALAQAAASWEEPRLMIRPFRQRRRAVPLRLVAPCNRRVSRECC